MLSPDPVPVDTEKKSREQTADPHPSYGVNANRSCTDVPCVIMFVLFWAVMIFLAQTVFKQGDPNRILYGTDMLGNNCGHGSVDLIMVGSSDVEWPLRKNIWYPLQLNSVSQSASVDSSQSIGVCVKECPKAGTLLRGYAPSGTPVYRIPFYVVLYDSFPVLHRCIPNISSLVCNSVTGCMDVHPTSPGAPAAALLLAAAEDLTEVTNETTLAPSTETSAPNSTTSAPTTAITNTTTVAPSTTATAAPNTTTGAPATPNPTTSAPTFSSLSVGGIAALRSLADDSINELYNYWWVVLVTALISIVLSFGWLFILRRTVKPLVVVTALLLLAVLVVGGILCWVMRNKSLDDGASSDADTPKYWLAGAIGFWVVAFLFLCVLLFLFRDVMTACDIIEEASKVPIKIPSMALVPLVSFVLVLPFVVWFMFVAVYIQSCGDTIVFTAPNVTLPLSFSSPSSNTSLLPGSFGNSTASSIELQNWRIPAHLYNLFIFLWTFGVLNAACFMVISLCAVFWYFSEPGDHKSPPLGSVMIATCTVVRYHLGTIFVGAFIVAVIQILRVILLIVEKKMSEALKKNSTVKGIMACLHCLMACLERVMKFINKNAYIMTAIKGTNFIESAQKALSLLVANALTVGAITIISEYVMIFGKVLITGISTLIAFGILKSQKGDNALRSGVLILAVVALFAFFIATLFVNIFSVCIDTILLCYCVDKDDTTSGKNYFPSDLETHVSKQAKKNGVVAALPVAAINNKEQPLLPLDSRNDTIDLL